MDASYRINLSPSDIKKRGSHFDIGMAIALLIQSNQIKVEEIDNLKRNELIAMLSDKVVIVQASKDSGAIYTATCGLKYNKEVYAVPGTIYDKCNEGTNILISNGANIYLSPDNILTGFNSVKIENKQNNCTEVEGMILSSLNKRSMSLDEIKSMVGLTDDKIEVLLFEMEIRGDIKQSGGVFT